MQKQSFDKCMAEYSDRELIQFHANINALFLCCNEDFNLLSLLMNIHFIIAERKTKLTEAYLGKLDEMFPRTDEWKYKQSCPVS